MTTTTSTTHMTPSPSPTPEPGSSSNLPAASSFAFRPETTPSENRVVVVPPRPQDGLKAWSVAMGSFLASLGVAGMLYSGGIFIPPLEVEYGVSLGDAALVNTMALTGFFIGGLFAVRLGESIGIKWVVVVGGSLWFLGMMLGSACQTLWESILTLGFMTGMGTSVTYYPVLAILPAWFHRYRATAVGMAVLGSSVGSVIFSLSGQQLIEALGWRNALRVIGGIGGALIIISILLVDRRLPPKAQGGMLRVMRELVRDTTVLLFCLGVFFFQFAFFAPYTFVSSYAISVGFSAQEGAFANAMLGVGSCLGRVTFGPIADVVGRITVFRFAVLGAAIALAAWNACTTPSALYATCAIFGACGGGFGAMFLVVISEMWGHEVLVGFLPLINLVSIPGAIAVGPVMGALVTQTGGYTASICLAASATFVGFICFLVARPRKFKEPQLEYGQHHQQQQQPETRKAQQVEEEKPADAERAANADIENGRSSEHAEKEENDDAPVFESSLVYTET